MLARQRIRKLFNVFLPNLIRAEIVRRFPNFYRQGLFKPYFAVLNITDRCNFKCIMCNQWRNRNDDELSSEEWKGILIQLKKEGIEKISISGGEPLLRADLIGIVRFAKSIGLRSSLITNGYLLEERIAEELVTSGVEFITVSVDGIGESFENIRGAKGSYKRVEKACYIVSEMHNKYGIGASIGFLLMKNTVYNLEDVIKLGKKMHLPLVVNLVDFTPYFFKIQTKEINPEDLWLGREDTWLLSRVQKILFAEKEADRKSIALSYSDIGFIKEYFIDPVQKDISCLVAQERICIDSKGNVFGGCWSMSALGSLRKEKLRDIVRNKKYTQAQKNMFFKNCPGCSCGYITNLRYNLSYLAKEMILVFPILREVFLRKVGYEESSSHHSNRR